MTDPRAWKQVGAYRWVCEPWTITRYMLNQSWMFALWRGEESHATSYNADRGALMALAKKLDEAEGKNA